MQSNFIIINDATGQESTLVDHRIIETALCVEDRQIENYYNVLKFSVDKNGRYTYESSVWGNETGYILHRKWAVFAWQQTGMEGSAICPQTTFDSHTQAAVEFARYTRAIKWCSDNRLAFPNNLTGTKDEHEQLRQNAGEFIDLVTWTYDTHPNYRSEFCAPSVRNPASYVAEIWVTP